MKRETEWGSKQSSDTERQVVSLITWSVEVRLWTGHQQGGVVPGGHWNHLEHPHLWWESGDNSHCCEVWHCWQCGWTHETVQDRPGPGTLWTLSSFDDCLEGSKLSPSNCIRMTGWLEFNKELRISLHLSSEVTEEQIINDGTSNLFESILYTDKYWLTAMKTFIKTTQSKLCLMGKLFFSK